VPVSCHITFSKRIGGELNHFIDRRPILFTGFFLGGLAWLGASVWFLAATLGRWLH
jgi:hypothetical protein